jgi:hypothetical protein
MYCEYCNNSFANVSALNKHKKTAKYCLVLQNNEVNIYTCNKCEKGFVRKDHLIHHRSICKKNNFDLEEEIESLKIKNEILKEDKKKLQNSLRLSLNKYDELRKDQFLKNLADDIQSRIKFYTESNPKYFESKIVDLNSIYEKIEEHLIY